MKILGGIATLVAVVVFLAVMRRFQIKQARQARITGILGRLEAGGAMQADDLGTLLKFWPDMSKSRRQAVARGLAKDRRFEGVDLNDPDARDRVYAQVMGVDFVASPEK